MKCSNCDKKMRASTAKDYHYTVSGLDNVYLSGMPLYKCTCGEVMVEIPNTEELHTAIVGELLRKPTLLSGEEIRFIRKQMKLKAVNLAKQLDVDPVTLSRWENSSAPIGQANDKLLRLMFLHNYINNIIRNHFITPQNMRKLIELANKIATTMYTLRNKKHVKIHISEKDLQKKTEEELLLASP